MKNYEKYENELREYDGSNFCDDFIIPYVFDSETHCKDMNCAACRMLQTAWLFKEYEEPKEPEVDWNNVKVDTPILVRDVENTVWMRRHFAKYENGYVWTWLDGLTSWTASNDDDMAWWKYAKLPENEEHKE